MPWRACQLLSAWSRSGSTATTTSMWPPRWKRSAGLLVPPRRQRPCGAPRSSSAGPAAWAQGSALGVEGTGSDAAGLARWLGGRGDQVVEGNRPDRQQRRRRGKSDPLDADAAARAALAGEDVATPKAANGTVELVRAVRVARRPAVHARTQPRKPARQPGRHRPRRAPLPAPRSGTRPAGRGRRRPPPGGGTGRVAATKLALGELARRHPALGAEIDRLDTELAKLAPKVAPALLARRGVGAGAAGAVLIAAGDNPGRLRSQGPRLRCCAGPRQSRRPRARRSAVGATAAVTAWPTTPWGDRHVPDGLRSPNQGLCRAAHQGRQVQTGRSSAAASALSLGRSIQICEPQSPLDSHRSIRHRITEGPPEARSSQPDPVAAVPARAGCSQMPGVHRC
jgi:uncharacterized small protein (DUF1192 family)